MYKTPNTHPLSHQGAFQLPHLTNPIVPSRYSRKCRCPSRQTSVSTTNTLIFSSTPRAHDPTTVLALPLLLRRRGYLHFIKRYRLLRVSTSLCLRRKSLETVCFIKTCEGGLGTRLSRSFLFSQLLGLASAVGRRPLFLLDHECRRQLEMLLVVLFMAFVDVFLRRGLPCV
jgi:hypothetical protein